MIDANNPELTSWIEVDSQSDFPIQNIPFGVFRPLVDFEKEPAIATRIGDYVIDIQAMCDFGLFDGLGIEDYTPLYQPSLNMFLCWDKAIWRAVRNRISELFRSGNPILFSDKEAQSVILFPQDEVEMLMPVSPGNYTDFYSGMQHAINVGKMFRDPDNPLLPNWKHMPVAYHGRSSSVIISGTDFHRPIGQLMKSGDNNPVLAPSNMLDFELEVAFVTGRGKPLGAPISVEEAADYIFGMVLFNDLSARDIQRWEYVPLGPFLGKNFASVISPWIITLDALAPFAVPAVSHGQEPLAYLREENPMSYDIHLEVAIMPEGKDASTICNTNYKYLYWTIAQQLAHHTINGCNVREGDLYASGTISGDTPDSFGSLLELTWNGEKHLDLASGDSRTYLQDNDQVIIKGFCVKDNIRIGFGEVRTGVLPLHSQARTLLLKSGKEKLIL